MLKLLDGVFITIGFKTQAAHARHTFPPAPLLRACAVHTHLSSISLNLKSSRKHEIKLPFFNSNENSQVPRF